MIAALFSIAYRNLVSKRLRSVVTALAIAVGTGVITATFTTNTAIQTSLEQTAASIAGNADLLVEAQDPQGFQDDSVVAVKNLPGVQFVAPRVQQRIFFRTSTQRGFVELLGVDPPSDFRLHGYRLLSGSFLSSEESRGLLVQEHWAGRLGVNVGASLELLTREGFIPFQVQGIVAEANPGQAGSGGVIRMHIATAQSLFGLTRGVQGLSIKVDNPNSISDLESQLPGLLRSDFVVRRVSQITQDLQDSVADFQTLLLFFGGIALFVGTFLVYNTLLMNVVDQTREIGLLRAVGASMSQVVVMTLVQGLLLGIAGTFPGVVFGQLLAQVLVKVLADTRQLAPLSSSFSFSSMLLGAAIGLVVTVLAALVPALRAGQLSPLVALRTIGVSQEDVEHRFRRILAFLGLVGLLVFLVWPVQEETRGLKALSLLPLFLLLVYLSPTYIGPLIWVSGILFRHRLTGIGVMAQRNVQRERGRTGVTVAGFFVSLAFVVALPNIASSAASAGQQWVGSLFPGDFVVVSPIPQPLVLVSEFEQLPEVDRVSSILVQAVNWNAIQLSTVGIDPTHYVSAFQFVECERISAFKALLRGNAVLLPAKFAREWGLKVGDVMRLRVGNKEVSFTVSGVIAHSLPSVDNYGALVLSARDLQRDFGADSFQFLAVSTWADEDQETAIQRLRQVAEQYGMEANTLQSLKLSVYAAMQQLLVLFVGLVVTGILVGSLGIVTTMMMNITQRMREIGILRAEGMTQGQVQVLTMAEAAILGFIGGVMGIAAGAFLTWVMIELSRTPEFDPQVSFSPVVALLSLALGILGAIVAALYPARRAARINIVAAVQHE